MHAAQDNYEERINKDKYKISAFWRFHEQNITETAGQKEQRNGQNDKGFIKVQGLREENGDGYDAIY